MKRNRLWEHLALSLLFFICIGHDGHSQANTYRTKADSMLQVLAEKPGDTVIFQVGINLSEQFLQLGKVDSALIYARMAFDMSNKLNYRRHSAYRQMGYTLSRMDKDKEALPYLWKGRELARAAGDSLQWCYILTHLANSYVRNTYDSAIHYSTEALKVAVLPKQKVYNYRTLGLVYYYTDQLDRAIATQLEAIDYAKKNASEQHLMDLYSHLAGFYFYAGKLDSATYIYQQLYDYHDKNKDIKEMLQIMGNLASVAFSKGRHKEAVDKNLQVLNLAREHGMTRRDNSTVFINLSHNLRMMGHLRKAYTYLDSAEQIVWHNKSNKGIESCFEERYRIDSTAGNTAQMATTLRQFMAYKDSVQKKENKQYVAELQTQYETEKKDQKIKSLSQQAEIQALTISKQNNQIVASVAVALTLLMGGYVYYRQSNIKKERAAAEVEQRFLRSQLNPHFVFNSMGAIQQYLLTNSAEDASYYMGIFSTLMRQILENSRREFITLAEEMDMLRNYLQLQQMRFEHQFSFQLEVDEDIDEDYTGVPPMFAQPFIENALEHGLFRNQNHENKVTIAFRPAGNGLMELIIEDTGVGMEVAVKSQDGHRSLAKVITQERLNLMKTQGSEKIGMIAGNVMGQAGAIKGYRVNLTLPTKLMTA